MNLELIEKIIEYIEMTEEHFKSLTDKYSMPDIYLDLIRLQAVLKDREARQSGDNLIPN